MKEDFSGFSFSGVKVWLLESPRNNYLLPHSKVQRPPEFLLTFSVTQLHSANVVI